MSKTANKPAATPSWRITRGDCRGPEAVMEFRRSEFPDRRKFDESAHLAAANSFAESELVTKYKSMHSELVATQSRLKDAAAAVIETDLAATKVAGDPEAFDAAMRKHDVAVEGHARLVRREELLRSSCVATWARVKEEFAAASSRINADVFNDTQSRIKELQAKLAEVAGPILDEIGTLIDRRDRGSRWALSMSSLGLAEPPANPKKNIESAEPLDFAEVGHALATNER